LSLLENEIKTLRSQGATNMDNALVVVQNPKNGDILANHFRVTQG
jgi:penicillin-binding protein 3